MKKRIPSVIDGYLDDIHEWRKDNDKFYLKLACILWTETRSLDEALTLYAYAVKLLKWKPRGLMLNSQGALLGRKLEMSRTQLYWKTTWIIARKSLYWGFVFAVGCLIGITSPLEYLLRAYLLDFDGGCLLDLVLRENHKEAMEHKVKIPYLHLEEELFTNNLLLGMDGSYWIDHAGNEKDRLYLSEDLKEIMHNFLKKRQE